MRKVLVFIHAWQIWAVPDGPSVLSGLATGRPRLPGRRRPIHTSLVVRFDPEANAAETLNTVYTLGRPLTRLLEDTGGRPRLIAVAGLVAERAPGTDDRWHIAEADRPIATIVEPDLDRVLDWLLDYDPLPEDLRAAAAPRLRPTHRQPVAGSAHRRARPLLDRETIAPHRIAQLPKPLLAWRPLATDPARLRSASGPASGTGVVARPRAGLRCCSPHLIDQPEIGPTTATAQMTMINIGALAWLQGAHAG